MHETSKEVFKEIERERPFCERQEIFHDHKCQGHSTMEHAFIYAGKQIPDKWAVIRICEWAHSVNRFQNGGGLDKEKNQYIALSHATEEDLKKYPKKDGVILPETVIPNTQK